MAELPGAEFADTEVSTNVALSVGVSCKREHGKVQLWAGGPYWATTNIGADEPWEYGYYFWWGGTVGYRRENDTWVANDGSMSGFSFWSENTLTCKDTATLHGEGLITAENTLAPKHDAARVLWGEGWRMPTDQEMGGLVARCDWSWATTNGVNGYIVRGRGDYASASIFLPCSGYGDGPSLNSAGSFGYYWSSVPLSDSDYYRAWNLCFNSSYHTTHYGSRDNVQSVRPVQGFTE